MEFVFSNQLRGSDLESFQREVDVNNPHPYNVFSFQIKLQNRFLTSFRFRKLLGNLLHIFIVESRYYRNKTFPMIHLTFTMFFTVFSLRYTYVFFVGKREFVRDQQ